MKNSRRIDYLAIATLTMMTLALPLSFLHISSLLFPESAMNRFYGTLVSSTSAETYSDAASKPILFIIRKPNEDIQIINFPQFDTKIFSPGLSPRGTCGNIVNI